MKFCVGSWVQQTPEEGQRTYRPKRCEYKNKSKDEDNSWKTQNNKNLQASSQKFRKVMVIVVANGINEPSSNPRWGCLYSPLC